MPHSIPKAARTHNPDRRSEARRMARKKKAAEPTHIRGSIEKHGRTYRARWMVNGKYYTRSTGAAHREQAEAKLAKFLETFKLKDVAHHDRVAHVQGGDVRLQPRLHAPAPPHDRAGLVAQERVVHVALQVAGELRKCARRRAHTKIAIADERGN